MPRRRLPPGLLLLATGFFAACLGDKVVAPDDLLPPDLAIDRPFIQLFRYARGRAVKADTVRLTNNGEGPLGHVEQVGGVDYLSPGRVGWLDVQLLNVGDDEAILILTPEYAEEAQESADIAEVVLKAERSPELRYVTVTARTLPGASFEFSVSPLAFAAGPGDPPSSQRITVRNGGNGTLTIHPPEVRYLDGSAGWLSVIPSGGTPLAPEFEVRADPGLLATGGLFLANLLFSSHPDEVTRADPSALEVQLNVGQPDLALSVSSLSFTVIRGAEDPEEEKVIISNGGAGPFGALGDLQVGDITYEDPEGGWLQASLVDSETVQVAVQTGALGPGEYGADIPMESENGGSGSIKVTLSVESPLLTPSPGTVSFGIVEGDPVLPDPAIVRITNAGAGTPSSLGAVTLGDWNPPVPWVSAILAPPDVILSLTPAAASLGVGSHSTHLPVESEFGGKEEVEVVLSVSRSVDDPILALSAGEVEFSGVRGDPPPPARTVRLSNGGGGTLGALSVGTVAYGGEAGWLATSLVDSTLTLSVSPGSLPEGTHGASVPVSSAFGGNGEVSVVYALGSPVLTASALAASFSAPAGGSPPPPQQITLSNTGPGTFASLGAVTAGPPTDPSWLSVSLADRTLTLTVTALPGGDGVYSSSVPISSQEGGGLSVRVTLTVIRGADAPDLVVSSDAVWMNAVAGGADPPDQTVWLSNGGGGSLGTLGVSESSPWLSTSGPGSSVTLSAQTGSLAAGTYQTTVTFTSANGGDETTEVTLEVGSALLTLSSEAASFFAQEGGPATPTSIQIAVTNSGAGEFPDLGAIGLGGFGAGWLDASLSGSGNLITLAPSPVGLGQGTYVETVPVNSQFGGNRSIEVTLSVTATPDPPELALSSENVSFFAEVSGSDPTSQWVPITNRGGGGFAALTPLSLGTVDYGAGPSGWLSPAVEGETLRLDVATGSTPAGTHSAQFAVNPSAGPSKTMSVEFKVGATAAGPVLELGAASVSFDARFGSDDPPQREVSVSNSGTGALGNIDVGPISYGPGASGWLSDTQASNTEVTLVPRTGTLAVGVYTATVPVSSSTDGTESLDVTFSIEAATLELETSAVTFSAQEGGGNPSGAAVGILNAGAGDLDDLGTVSLGPIVYSPSVLPWLSASAGAEAVDLQATTGTLSAGTYRATVPVASTLGGDDLIAVTFTVGPSEDPADLLVSPPSIRMDGVLGGGNPPDQTVLISNAGGGELGVLEVMEDAPWLTASVPVTSTVISADLTGLGTGTYSTTVQVTSGNGGSESVPVTLVVSQPILTLSAQELSFSGKPSGAAPLPQRLTASNTGAGTYADLGNVTIGTASYGPGGSGWITTPASGSPVGEGGLDVGVSLAGLTPGTYTAGLLVLSQNGGNQSVSLTLSVVRETDPPRLVLSTTTLRFGALLGGADPSPELVYVSNGGGGSLGTVQVGPPNFGPGAAEWLSGAHADGVITASSTASGLKSGEYVAVLPVKTENGGSTGIDVTLVVGAPRLTATPNTIAFGDTLAGTGPPPARVNLENTGGGTSASLGPLTLGAAEYGPGAEGWLEGTLNGQSLDLSALTGDLEVREDPYEARLPVQSQFGGADTVVALFTISPGGSPPSLVLSVDSLLFAGIVGGGPPAPQTVTAFNGGGGILGSLEIREISYSQAPEGWLSYSPDENTFSFQPSIDGLPGGSHRASVIVGSEYGQEDTVTVGLDLAQPVISLSTPLVTFSDTVGSPDSLRSRVFVTNTGGGDRSSLGDVIILPIFYPSGSSSWLITDPAPGSNVSGNGVELTGSAADMAEGDSEALVVCQSQWGGSDTVVVAFSARKPDRSFDLPTIELVRPVANGGIGAFEALPGDSVTATAESGSMGQLGLRVGVRNGSETRITLSGLRVSIPSYPPGQPTGWITGAFLDRTTATHSEPAELAVAIDPGGLADGRYEASLVVSSEAAGLEEVEARTLRVILRIG